MRVELLADHLLHALGHAEAERQQRVDAGAQLAHVARPQQQAVGRHLGLGGVVAERGEEQVGQAHGAKDTGPTGPSSDQGRPPHELAVDSGADAAFRGRVRGLDVGRGTGAASRSTPGGPCARRARASGAHSLRAARRLAGRRRRSQARGGMPRGRTTPRARPWTLPREGPISSPPRVPRIDARARSPGPCPGRAPARRHRAPRARQLDLGHEVVRRPDWRSGGSRFRCGRTPAYRKTGSRT